jgi:hypothetical protein
MGAAKAKMAKALTAYDGRKSVAARLADVPEALT